MKKRTKWIILAASVLTVLLVIIGIILFAVLRDPYLDKLPYDDMNETMYRNTAIVAEDGLWYLEIGGERSKNGYTYLKSVNDFYQSEQTEDLASRYLFEYYLAKTSDQGNYLLLDGVGREYRLSGDNFSLTEVALPYLIFTNNTNSRMAALSLFSLQSELSSHSENELALTQTFPSLSAHKFDSDSELYDYLLVRTDSEEKTESVYSSSGARLLSGTHIRSLVFENKNEEPVYYFLDEGTFSLYTAKGIQLSDQATEPILSEDESWGYQVFEKSAAGGTKEKILLVFTAEHSFTLSDTEYDPDTLQIWKNCFWLRKLHADTYTVVCPETKTITDYDTLRAEEGLLVATLANEPNKIYLDSSGKELLRSPYDDMQQHELSGDRCTVLTSIRCNAEGNKTISYFFTSPDREAVRLDLPLHSSISKAPDPSSSKKKAPIYLISETDQDGTPLVRIYSPFSVNTQSNAYHTLDFYCHGGILWAMGTSYTGETYDILDPVNNRVSLSIAAKSGDLARLTFEYCDVNALLSSPTKEDSSVPVLLLKLARYDEKHTQAVAARYFALYRTAAAESKNFQNTTLQVKELGQNLLLSQPYRFFGPENCLAIYSLSGTRIFRLDESCSLVEHASIPYHVTDLLADRSDPSLYHFVITAITDGSVDLSQSARVGLADSGGNLLLSPYYETIEDVDQNRFTVTLRNAQGVVEYREGKIKTLIDFRYVSIIPLGDGGYAALRRDGTCDLYEGGNKLGKGDLQSIASIVHARPDDDGYLVYSTSVLLNLNGRLYLHAAEQSHAPICRSVTLPDSYSFELTDRRAKLISYYDTSGKLTETDLLLPTVTDEKAFTENHTDTWFSSALPQKQTEPVSVEDVLASEDHFFHLYPAATQSDEDDLT